MAVQDAQVDAKLHDETLSELGLTEQPFLEDKKRQRFADSITQKTRAALEQHVRFGDSLHLLIGESGSGKTVLLQQLLKHCKNSIKPFVAKGSPDFRADAFLYAVLNDLNKEAKAETTSEYIDALAPVFEQITEDQLSALMIVDDAHLAPIEEIAELVDILQHFENQDGKTARLLLTGTPALKNSIGNFEAQFDDLDLHYSTNMMHPMDEARTRDYLSSRLHQAGFADAFPFTDKAIAKIQRESAGLPGNINTTATHYLNGVYRGGAEGEAKAGWLASLEWPVLAVGAAALCAIGLGLSMFFGNEPETKVIPIANTGTTEVAEQPIVATSSVNEPAQPVVQPTSQNNTAVTSPVATTPVVTNDESDPLVLPSDSTIDSETIVTATAETNNSSTDLVQETPAITTTPTIVESTIAPVEAIVTNATDVAQTTIGNANTDLVLPNLETPAADLTTQVGSATQQNNETPVAVTVPQIASAENTASSKSVGATGNTPASVPVIVSDVNAADTSIADANVNVSDNALLQDTTDDIAVGTTDNGVVVDTPTNNGVSVLVEGDTDASATAPEDNSFVVQPEPTTGIAVTDPNRAIENERWVLFQSPTKFTVQLATSRERGYIIDLAQSMNVQDPVAIYPFLTTNSNNPVFGLLSGLYDTRAEAIAAVESMSDDSKQFGVWIRPVSDLQEDIKRRN